VVDPQKYADQVLHERYLRRLAGHSAVTVVLLNQVDTVNPFAAAECAEDLRRLLDDDGLRRTPVLTCSARTARALPTYAACLSTPSLGAGPAMTGWWPTWRRPSTRWRRRWLPPSPPRSGPKSEARWWSRWPPRPGCP
jgi:hypothetical protein